MKHRYTKVEKYKQKFDWNNYSIINNTSENYRSQIDYYLSMTHSSEFWEFNDDIKEEIFSGKKQLSVLFYNDKIRYICYCSSTGMLCVTELDKQYNDEYDGINTPDQETKKRITSIVDFLKFEKNFSITIFTSFYSGAELKPEFYYYIIHNGSRYIIDFDE